MKLLSSLLPYVLITMMVCPTLTKAQPIIDQQPSLNMIAYEYKALNQYATVLYMPYYPAYGMISFKTPECNANIAGYIDPFALKRNKLIITYKTCKVSFNISQNNQELKLSNETKSCEAYRSKNCNFSQIPNLKQILLGVKQ